MSRDYSPETGIRPKSQVRIVECHFLKLRTPELDSPPTRMSKPGNRNPKFQYHEFLMAKKPKLKCRKTKLRIRPFLSYSVFQIWRFVFPHFDYQFIGHRGLDNRAFKIRVFAFRKLGFGIWTCNLRND